MPRDCSSQSGLLDVEASLKEKGNLLNHLIETLKAGLQAWLNPGAWIKCTGIYLSASLSSVMASSSCSPSPHCGEISTSLLVSSAGWPSPQPGLYYLTSRRKCESALPLACNLLLSKSNAPSVDAWLWFSSSPSSSLIPHPRPSISNNFPGLHFFPVCTQACNSFSVQPHLFLTSPPPYPSMPGLDPRSNSVLLPTSFWMWHWDQACSFFLCFLGSCPTGHHSLTV